jgi:hypothetical protein
MIRVVVVVADILIDWVMLVCAVAVMTWLWPHPRSQEYDIRVMRQTTVEVTTAPLFCKIWVRDAIGEVVL